MPTDYQQGPLPIPPSPLMGGSATESPASPNAGRMSQLQRQVQSPLYRFGSALAGSNPAAEEMRGLQHQDLQQQQFALQQKQFQAQMEQFVTTKKLALGGMAVQFLEKVAAAKPDQRAALVEIGGQFLGPMLKEIGFDLPVNLLKKMTDTPGLATRFGALIADNFQDEASQKQVLGEISALDEKDIPDYVGKRWKQAQEAALPRVQQTLTKYAQLIRGDKGVMARLGLLDDQGKPKPIPGELLLGQVDQIFKTSAEKAMAMRVLGTPEHSPFLASLGIQPGTLAEDRMKIIGAAEATEATRKGAADVRSAEAGATTAEATAGVAGRKAAAETTKLEAEAGVAGPKAQADLAQTRAATTASQASTEKTRLEIQRITQELQSGKIEDAAGLRKEYTALPTVKTWQDVRDSFGRLDSFSKDNSGASDMKMVFSFMKMLDPTSAVRETEYANAQNTTGVPDRILNAYNKAKDGQFLSPKQREDFRNEAQGVLKSHLQTLVDTEAEFKRLAAGRNIKGDEAVPDLAGRFRKYLQDTAEKPGTPKAPRMSGEPTRAR